MAGWAESGIAEYFLGQHPEQLHSTLSQGPITGKSAICHHRRLSHTAFLTVMLTLTLNSGFALSATPLEPVKVIPR